MSDLAALRINPEISMIVVPLSLMRQSLEITLGSSSVTLHATKISRGCSVVWIVTMLMTR